METVSSINSVVRAQERQFVRNLKGFAAPRISPPLAVSLQAGSYYIFAATDIANAPLLTPRAPGSPYKRQQTRLSTDNYACENYGLEVDVADEEREKYANFFQADIVKMRRGVDTTRINREQRVVTLANTAPSANISTPWNDPAGNPKTDTDAVCEVIRNKTGNPKSAITMTINHPTFLALQQHPKLADLFKLSVPNWANEDKLASYLGLRRVVVAYNIKATNNEGQTFTAADIWGNVAFFSVDDDGLGDLTLPCWSRTLYWDAMLPQVVAAEAQALAAEGAPMVPPITSYREEHSKSVIHRIEDYTAEKIVCLDCGYLLNGCLV